MQICCKPPKAFPFGTARSGFTILEVLIASLVGAVIFLALFTGMAQGFNLVQHERASLRATQIIVGKIEGIRLCAWGTTNQLFNSTITPSTFTDYFYPVGMTNFNGSNIVYNGTVDIKGTNITFYNASGIATTTPSYSNFMARVIVTVTWNEVNHGRTNTYLRSMRTYVAQYGLQNYITSD